MLRTVATAFIIVSQVLSAELRWQSAAGYRSTSVEMPKNGKTGLALVPSNSSGITFTNKLSQQRLFANHNLMNGSGVALGDFDGDGWCDIYLCNLEGANALYRNLGGWKFQDVTASAGVGCTDQTSTGAVFADLNGDGKLDLVVAALGGPNSLFINQGNGKFVDVAAAAGITSRFGAMTMALGDVDGNGTQDLYIANYGATSILRSGGSLNLSYVKGKPVVRGRYAQRIQIIGNTMFELGEPDALYLNDGTGKFKAVSWTDGTFLDHEGKPLQEAPWDQGLCVMFRDVDGDRAPDIYVCNDAFTPDQFWINDGKGKFRAISPLAWRTTSHSSMGVDFTDYDRDGDDDFFVVDMLSRERRYLVTQKGTIPPQPRAPGDLFKQTQIRRNTFYENRGDGTYAEVANQVGLAATEWSWNPVFIDLDLDGWEDLLVSNGFPFNMDDMDTKDKVRTMGKLNVEQSRRTLLMYPELDTPNMSFRNMRGTRFEDTTEQWGFDSTEVSNGVSLGDLDNDGDPDVVVNTFNGPALVYRNESSAPRLLVRLKGKAPNTQGIGAKIIVRGGPVVQSQEVISGGRYAGGDDPARLFATGDAKELQVEVLWRNGTRSVVDGILPNRIYEIDEAVAQNIANESIAPAATLFADVSDALGHRHHEEEFNDFERQPSLPHRLSQSGPGLAWFDLDGNGFDDLIAGSGRGGKLEILYNEQGKFQRVVTGITAPDDMTAVVAWRKSNEVAEIIVGLSNFETGGTNRLLLLEARGTNITQSGSLTVNSAISALTMMEANGTRFVFAAGKFVPGHFPEPAPSQLFRLKEGQWVEDEKAKAVLARAGAVTGAASGDLDGDGSPELLVACDWGAIRIFEFNAGALRDATAKWNTGGYVGRWQSIATGDFDKDGRLDFVAGNWGTNSFYNQAQDGLVELFFGDYNDDGRVEMIETYREPGGKVVPWREKTFFAESLPWLEGRFPAHASYAAASITEILGDLARKGSSVRTTTLSSTMFLNRGEKVEVVALPREAQFTPVYGIAVADFNGDGFQDLALAQNLFGTREQDGPLDAGRGLVLTGSAGGKMIPMNGMESGVIAYGEQRSIAVADFDQDGRLDLVVGQNGTETKLFRNTLDQNGTRRAEAK